MASTSAQTSQTLVISGYTELVKASKLLIPAERAATRAAFARVGEIVRGEGARDLIEYKQRKYDRPQDAVRSASSFKVRVRQRGVEVEQSLRKTTAMHPEWGAAQMKHGLLPAVYSRRDEVQAEFEKALDEVTAIFNRV